VDACPRSAPTQLTADSVNEVGSRCVGQITLHGPCPDTMKKAAAR
jgi:hypothetical protein